MRQLLGFERKDLVLLANLLRMSLRDRFLGSGLGRLWAVANPLLMLATFTFVFGYVFKAKMPGAETSLAYVTWLISGYGPWLAISEGLATSATSVVSNASLVKNLAFKTELLPIAGALMGAVPLGVSLIYLACLIMAGGTAPSSSWLILPLVVVLHFLLITGMGLFLAALNVFVRDVSLVLPNILLIALFASPIFYPEQSFPPSVRPFVAANPFYVIAEGYRQPLFHQSLPDLWGLLYLGLLGSALFWSGLRVFRRLKGFFDSRL